MRKWIIGFLVLTCVSGSAAARAADRALKRYPLVERPSVPKPPVVTQRSSSLGMPNLEGEPPTQVAILPSVLRLPPVPAELPKSVEQEETAKPANEISVRLPPPTESPSDIPREELPPVPAGPPLFPPPPPAMPVPASGLAGLEASISPPAHIHDVETDCGVAKAPYFNEDFGRDPICHDLPYDPRGELNAYEGKTCIPAQRPWVEWGRPFYDWGQFPPSPTPFGCANPVYNQFLVYGDFRNAIASNNTGGNNTNLLASRLNLELDWRITSTERFHMALQPMNKGQDFTRLEFGGGDDLHFEEAFNLDPFTGYFEGDLGAIWGGVTNQVLPFDCPVAVGLMPLVFQNGIWLEDNTLGAAITIPARNSPLLDIANYDITFFYLFDDVTSPAFQTDNNAGQAYGIASFFDVLDGYLELDYAYLEDRARFDRSYHNTGVGFTRRYFSFLSNSVRLISNFGQDPDGISQTADGHLVLLENSLITSDPYLFVPYWNAFYGFGRTQSVARNGAAGGILRNTGILFETDNLTGYPTLDPTGVNTYGGAVGVNLIPATIDRQLVVEYAFVGLHGNPIDRNLRGQEHGIGMRYQKNLTNAWLFRADTMYGFRDNTEDISGARMELRYKF